MLLLDGRRAEGRVRLEAGPHTIRLAVDAGLLYLTPAGVAGSVTVLLEPVQRPLFEKAHSF